MAMPLLVLTLGFQAATALVGLVMLTTIAMLLSREWRSLDVQSAWRLLLSSAVGIPVGVLGVRLAPETILKVTLGILLISFSLYSLTRPALPRLRCARWVYSFGFAAGVLGGAYNANAPPVVVYGAMQLWASERFRATLQGYFLPAAMLICTGMRCLASGLLQLPSSISWRYRVSSWRCGRAGSWGAACLWRNSSVRYTGCLLP
jgi:uncharacterized membrane protein YfcA